MKDIHKELIDQIQDERMPTHEELSTMQDILSANLLGNPISFSNKRKNTTKIFIPQRMTRIYSPDLEEKRETMEDEYYSGNHTKALQQIIYLLAHYENYLSCDDTINAYLFLIDIKSGLYTGENEGNIDEILSILEHIKPYEQQLDSQQKFLFWKYLGNACFSKAGISDEQIYYQRANDAFDKVLHMNHIHKDTIDTSDELLDIGSYKEILHFKILSLSSLREYRKTLSVINTFLETCGWNPVTSNYKDPNDEEKLSEIFFIQGGIYEDLNNYENAIRSYENYLLFEPDNKDMKKHIRFLSEQLGE